MTSTQLSSAACLTLLTHLLVRFFANSYIQRRASVANAGKTPISVRVLHLIRSIAGPLCNTAVLRVCCVCHHVSGHFTPDQMWATPLKHDHQPAQARRVHVEPTLFFKYKANSRMRIDDVNGYILNTWPSAAANMDTPCVGIVQSASYALLSPGCGIEETPIPRRY